MIHAGQLVSGHFIMAEGAQEWQELGASPFAGYLPQVAPPAAPPAARPGPPVQHKVQPLPVSAQRAPAPVKKKSPWVVVTAALTLLAAGGGYFWHQRTAAPIFPSATKEKTTAWNNRCSPAERLETLRRSAGSPEVEAAVNTAFEYLKRKQNPDGSWGTHNRVGDSALALLAYAGRCETADSPSYGDTIMKAILFLVETSHKNSQGVFASDVPGGHDVLIHRIATDALGQTCLAAHPGSKTVPGMREAFEKGVRHIIETNPSIADKASSPPLELAWQCEALHTAKVANLKFAGLDDCISRTVSSLSRLQNADGGFGTRSDMTKYDTGFCVHALQLFPDGNQVQIDNAIRYARQQFQKEPLGRENFEIHSVLFYTRAFHRLAGDDWRFWNSQMLPALLARAKPDGSFLSSGSDDAIDLTSLGILILETYYGGD